MASSVARRERPTSRYLKEILDYLCKSLRCFVWRENSATTIVSFFSCRVMLFVLGKGSFNLYLWRDPGHCVDLKSILASVTIIVAKCISRLSVARATLKVAYNHSIKLCMIKTSLKSTIKINASYSKPA